MDYRIEDYRMDYEAIPCDSTSVSSVSSVSSYKSYNRSHPSSSNTAITSATISKEDWHKIWSSIHIICKVYNPKTLHASKALICFFECLVDLLPHKSACHILNSFMKQNPLEESVESSDKVFEWSYYLHNYLNIMKRRKGQTVVDISLEEAKEEYSTLNKTMWGNALWFLIHYIAYNLPEKITPEIASSYKAFIVSLRYLIPCPECGKHMHEYLSENVIDDFLVSNRSLFYWTWVFHNSVNKRLNKPCPSINQVVEIYSRK